VRSATPEGLAAARARLLAIETGGSPAPGGDLAFTATLEGGALKVRIPPAEGATPGPVRVTVAFDNASEVQHIVIPEVSLEKGWEHELKISPRHGARRAAVLVEDLAHGRWGGMAIGL
jgi:hypothetical protein